MMHGQRNIKNAPYLHAWMDTHIVRRKILNPLYFWNTRRWTKFKSQAVSEWNSDLCVNEITTNTVSSVTVHILWRDLRDLIGPYSTPLSQGRPFQISYSKTDVFLMTFHWQTWFFF